VANITREAVTAFQDAEVVGAVAGFPPGYIEGFRPVLLSNLTVEVGGGVTSVDGSAVYMKEQILTQKMWNGDPVTGGSEGFYYYVYLSRAGEYQIDFTKPEYSGTHYYYAHPTHGWRVILRLWVDTDNSIKFVSRQYKDTQRTVTVAPADYVGEADYYCDGVNDEIWIKTAIEYADRVELLKGTFEIANAITITKENWEMMGSGAVIKPTAAITLGDGTLINNITLRNIRVKGMSSYKSLFVGNTVNSLVLDGCTFEMNTGFTATSCHFMAVRNCYFKGIDNYVGGRITFVSCTSFTVLNNSFRYYGTPGASSYAVSCMNCSGTIDGNSFYNSCAVLIDATSDVAFSISGNDHQDPVLFYDEGDANYGPGVAYGSNTATA
jgi:hypothetical protein